MKQLSHSRLRSTIQAILFLMPGFIIYTIFLLYPIYKAFRLSLTDWNGITEPNYIDIQNYINLMNDEVFWNAFQNNLFFIMFYTILPIIIGLFLASIMTRGNLRGMVIFRTGLFIPQVLSTVVVGIIWRWFFATNGPINEFLEIVGLETWTKPWLGDFDYAPYAAGAVGTWVEYGLAMVLFIAGVQGISQELYDAAVVDGANALQEFWYITLPGLKQQVMVVFIITFIAALRVFGMIFVLTRGGPGRETEVVSILIYEQAFRLRQTGYSTAMALVLTAFILIVSALVFVVQTRLGDEA